MKNAWKFILLTVLIARCNPFSNEHEVAIIFHDVSGLSVGAGVTLNGLQIGSVKSIKLDQSYQVITTISLTENLPADSRFFLKANPFGGAQIIAVSGKSPILLKEGQRVDGEELMEKPKSEQAIPFLNSVLGTSKNDSLLIELRELNRNIKKLMQK